MNEQKKKLFECTTETVQETQDIAQKIARAICTRYADDNPQGAVTVTLSGDLGAGKTTFAQGFLGACGAQHPFTSPTFGIIKEYDIVMGRFKRVYHIDPYRITKEELEYLGWQELKEDSCAIILLEWPEILEGDVSKEMVAIRIFHRDEKRRKIEGESNILSHI